MATAAIFLMLFELTVVACGGSWTGGAERRLILAGGGIGGGTYSTLSGIANILMKYSDLDVKVVPGGGLINLIRTSRGEIHGTIGNVPFMSLARSGDDPFDAPYEGFRTVVQPGGGPVMVHFVVDASLPITSVADIVEQQYPLSLAVDRKGTHDNWILNHVLEFYGVDTAALESWGGAVREVGYNDQIMLLQDGYVDAVLQNIQVPSGSLVEGSSRRSLKFLDFPPELVEHMESLGWSEMPNVATDYDRIAGDYSTSSIGYLMPLIVHSGLSDDVVYEITRILCEHADETRQVHRAWSNFDPATAWKETGGELHPGARRYFEEQGYLGGPGE
jgi:TRAP transporter TAXI family solute receptor